MKILAVEKQISDETKNKLDNALTKFKEEFVYEEKTSLL